MAEKENLPPKIERDGNGGPDPASLADLLEWFLNFDQKVAQVRHPFVEELFQWKQQDDMAQGTATYPFENAESRFAIGAFQAIRENDTEALLNDWITDILNALQEAKNLNSEISQSYKLDSEMPISALEKARNLPTEFEKRMFLSSCWIEALCTAEARFLGWVYQDIYGKPFQPGAAS